jgi:uncharacterized protein YecT (DUF1311 family)
VRRLHWATGAAVLLVALAALAVTQIAGGSAAKPASYQSCLRHSSSTVATEACIAAERKRLEAAMSAALDKVAARPGLGTRGRDLLAAGQRAWKAFERRDCSFPSYLVRGGTLAPVAFGKCVVSRERQRLAELRSYVTFPQ